MMKVSQLRPVFFRTGEGKIESGWIDIRSGDIWADGETDADHGKVLLPHAVPALLIGERVRFMTEVDIWPEGFVEPGDRGVVCRRDRTSGAVEVLLEGFQIGDNLLALQPHFVEEQVLLGIELHSDMFTAKVAFRIEDFADVA
jgi:hypothetical protein